MRRRSRRRRGRNGNTPAAVVDAEGELARYGNASIDHCLVELGTPPLARLGERDQYTIVSDLSEEQKQRRKLGAPHAL